MTAYSPFLAVAHNVTRFESRNGNSVPPDVAISLPSFDKASAVIFVGAIAALTLNGAADDFDEPWGTSQIVQIVWFYDEAAKSFPSGEKAIWLTKK